MLATLRNGMRVALLADGMPVDHIKSQLQEMYVEGGSYRHSA